MGPLRKHKKGKARPADGAGPGPSAPTPSDQATLLRRLESHARAFFGEEEEESEEDACAPPSASRPPHVAPVPAADSDASTNDDSSDGEGEISSSSEDEEKGARGARGGAHGAPPPPTRRPPVVVVAGPSGGRRAAPPATAAAAPPPPALDLRAERKALMTGTVDVTVGGGPLPAWKHAQQRRPLKKKQEPAAVPAPAGAADASAMPTKAEFAAMRREVEDFGVANLDKRARFAAETRHLTSLGFPAPKRPRIPASIGLGMASKQKELAAASLEAAIDAGLVSRSGLGKKKRRAAEAARRAAGAGDGGLDGSGPLRNGVLFVKEAPVKKRKGGGKRFNVDKIKL